MGYTEPCLFESDEQIAAAAIDAAHPNNAGISLEKLQGRGWMRLAVPERRLITIQPWDPSAIQAIDALAAFINEATEALAALTRGEEIVTGEEDS